MGLGWAAQLAAQGCASHWLLARWELPGQPWLLPTFLCHHTFDDPQMHPTPNPQDPSLTNHTIITRTLQEYLGSYVSDESGRLVFREGLLVQAVRQGHWIVLDELNLAPTEVLEALNRWVGVWGGEDKVGAGGL